LRAKLASEREAAARARQYESDRSAHLSSELDALDTRLRDIARDRDLILSKLREAQAETDKAAATARRLANVHSEVATLETALRTAREARSQAEAEASRLRAEASKLPTVKELERLLDVQAKELESLKSARQERQRVVEAADAARKEANEALKALREAQARESAANEKAETLGGLLKDAATNEEELQLFVQVALEFLGRNSADENENDVVSIETLKSEVRAFCKEVYSSKPLPPNAMTILDEEVLALRSENAKLKTQVQGLQAEVSHLESDITALKEEGESLFKELESVTEAYESLKEQNARLIDGIKARDEDNVRLMGEASTAAMERAVALDDLLVEKEAARKAEHEMQAAKSQAEELESRVHELGRELDGVRKELTMANSRGDAATRERDATQAALSAVRRDMEEAQKSVTRTREERDAEEERARKAITRAERAEAELLDARKGQDSLKSAGGDDGQLVAECTALRKMVNCNVCHTRLKDRIITKCNHIFCSQCIEANLATRHRKCPGCAERFGAGDVKPFFFT
jgi:E3 ubiquitin-protein ligase BRE1